MAKFDPHRVKTPKLFAIKLSWVIRSTRRPAVPNLVQINAWGVVGGDIPIFDYYSFLYMPFFPSNSRQVRLLNRS